MRNKTERSAAVFLAAALLILSGCVHRPAVSKTVPEATETPSPLASPTPTSAPTPPPPTPPVTFTPEPTATPEPTPVPTPEPSPTPEGSKARRSGKRIVPGDWGEEIPLRNAPADDSFFNSACMIGNSLVQGFQLWSGLHNIQCLAETGATVYSVVKEMDLRPVRNNRYSDVYVMLGLNEVGMETASFIENYAEVIDYIRAFQPNANIIVISVTPVMRWVDQQPYTYYTMDNINAFNDALRSMCAEKQCWFLDLSSALTDEEGYLSEVYAYKGDGKHLEANGYELWADYMRNHYVNETLLAE